MSGCIDRIDCDCECREKAAEWCKKSRNMISSITAGTLFGLGWWIIIDFTVLHAEPLYAAYFICGILSTVGLFMVNAISTGQVTEETYTDGCMGRRGARIWFFFGFLFAFGGLIGSLWILIQKFLVVAAEDHTYTCYNGPNGTNGTNGTALLAESHGNDTRTCSEDPHVAQGVAFFLQNFLILLSTLIFKFGRTEDEEDSF